MKDSKKNNVENLIHLIPDFTSHYVEVNGTKLHYVSGGQGEPLLLIPGYPETWWAYHKIMPMLAQKYHVIVVEMRGMGSSDKPVDGYEKKNMAKDIFELVKKIGFEKVSIGGHDIGAHVAFSFAANHSEVVSKLIMLDTPHPDAGMYQLPMLPILGADYLYPWWLAFNQVKELPEQLLEGRMHFVIDWLFKNLLYNQSSMSQFDREVYAFAYDNKDAIRPSNAWYQSFPQDIEDSKTYDKLTMPVLGIGGTGYDILKLSLPLVTTNLQLKKIAKCGHFVVAEKPDELVKVMTDFLDN